MLSCTQSALFVGMLPCSQWQTCWVSAVCWDAAFAYGDRLVERVLFPMLFLKNYKKACLPETLLQCWVCSWWWIHWVSCLLGCCLAHVTTSFFIATRSSRRQRTWYLHSDEVQKRISLVRTSTDVDQLHIACPDPYQPNALLGQIPMFVLSHRLTHRTCSLPLCHPQQAILFFSWLFLFLGMLSDVFTERFCHTRGFSVVIEHRI